MTSGLIYTIIYNEFRFDYLNNRLWGGLTLTIASGLTFFIWNRQFNRVLGLTLILGTINLIGFIPITMTFGGGVSGHTVSLQLFSFLTLLIFSYINRQRIKKIISEIIKDKPLTEKETEEQRERKINGFKLKYNNKTIDELTRISNSDTFDKDAIEAARRLLNEKNAR